MKTGNHLLFALSTIKLQQSGRLLCLMLVCFFNASSQAAQTAISLGMLSRIAGESLGQTKPLPMEAQTLCGIAQVDSYVVDFDNRDIVLVGRQDSARTTLRYDDLILLLRNTWKPIDSPYPYCSLDPKPENIQKLRGVLNTKLDLTNKDQLQAFAGQLRNTIGGQQVVVGGVPFDSHIAHAMIEADYLMKQVSQGQKQIPEIPSFIEHSNPHRLSPILTRHCDPAVSSLEACPTPAR
jgi:hypothetical protein